MKFRALMVPALVLMLASSAFAQTAPSKVQGFFDVGVVFMVSATSSFTATASTPLYGETESVAFNYRQSSLVGADVAGGVFFTKNIGLAIGMTSGSGTGAGEASLTLPHPLYPQSPATGVSPTASLKQSEVGVHLMGVVRTDPANPFQMKVFGGASHYSLKRPLFDNVTYVQNYGRLTSMNIVTVTSAPTRDVTAGAWGFNAGADVGYFFTKHFGAGALVRYGSASVSIPNTAAEFLKSDGKQTVKAGGFSFGGGLRTRF